MAVKTVTVREYRCDGCGEAVWSPEDDSPKGYTGAVTFDDGGLGGEFQFFACRKAHLNRAIKNALAQFGEDGKVADVELPPVPTPEADSESASTGAPGAPDNAGESADESATPGEPSSEPNVEGDDTAESAKPRSRRGHR